MDAQNFGKRACRRPCSFGVASTRLSRFGPCPAAKQDEVAQRFNYGVLSERVVASDADLVFPLCSRVIGQFFHCLSIRQEHRCTLREGSAGQGETGCLPSTIRSRGRELLESALSLALRLYGHCELTGRHGNAAAFNYRD